MRKSLFEKMLKLIKQLSKKPRIAGFNSKTTRFLDAKLKKLGFEARIQTVKFIGWKNIIKPKLKIDGRAVKVLPLIWSGSGKVKGKLKYVGKFKTFEAYEWHRWAIKSRGKTKGYILSRPDMVWMQLVDNKSKLPYFMVYPDVCKKLLEEKNAEVEGSVKNKFIPGLKIYNIITKNNSKKMIIVCAHYDSMLGAPGANDNASGVAALLEVAKKNKDVQFILFDAEEWNKTGSYAYVRSLPKKDLKKIKYLVNIDMVGAGKIFVMCSKQLEKPLKRLFKGTKIIPTPRPPFDIWPFYKKGASVIHFGASPYKYCHDPEDTHHRINSTNLSKTAKMVNKIIKNL